MFKKTFSLVGLSLVALTLVACNPKSRDENKGAAEAPKPSEKATQSFSGSYLAVSECTTEQQIFSASTEKELETAFCAALKDEKRNKNCAINYRQQIFKLVECSGEFTLEPKDKENASNTSYMKNYSMSENGCGTGAHYFVASTEKKSFEIYCKALKNDELNHGCAKNQRAEKYAEDKCGEH